MLSAEASARHIVVTDTPTRVPLALGTLSFDERRVIERMVDILEVGPDFVVVRRNRRHIVGRSVVGGWSLSVPPPFDPSILLGLILYAYRVDLELIQRAKLISAPLERASEVDLFLQMMAALVISEARAITIQHVAQAWEPVTERSHNPKGRILWRADFGHHPGTGVSHVHRLKTTDTGLNRLVLAGVRAASVVLRDTALRGDANRQEFVWRELARDAHPSSVDFDLAEERLNRLTRHYAPCLALSRALVLGLTPSDYFASSREEVLPALEFNLPSIFERFMERLLAEVAATRSRLGVAFQAPDRAALLDPDGGTYRSVRPDIELRVDGRPVAVVDAKFKPHYVAPEGTRKVSTADIYQLLFYQARVAQRSGGRVVPAAIAAPQVQDEPPPDAWPREVVWRQEGRAERRVSVLAVPLGALLERLRLQPAREALAAAPELQAFLEREWVMRASCDSRTRC